MVDFRRLSAFCGKKPLARVLDEGFLKTSLWAVVDSLVRVSYHAHANFQWMHTTREGAVLC